MRMLDSVIGCFKPNFLEDIGDKGDLCALLRQQPAHEAQLNMLCRQHACSRAVTALLARRYGPFWIATTLVSLTGIIGNFGVEKVTRDVPVLEQHEPGRCTELC